MNKFGVNIDLSIFFEDERKMVLVMVDPKWENVECLQKRVEFLFDVDFVKFVNSDGYFLPPQEPIEILKFCKGLKAFVPREALEKRKKKKSKKEEKSSQGSESEETAYTKGESQKKRKSLASPTPNNAKRLKNYLSIDHDKLLHKSSEISSTSEQMPPPSSSPPSVSSKKSKAKKSKKAPAVTSADDEIIAEGTSLPCELSADEENMSSRREDNGQNKKRHTSTPKEKKTFECIQNVEKAFNDEINARPSSIPSSTFINESEMTGSNKKSLYSTQSPNIKNPFKRQSSNKSKGHIYFNKSGEMISTISTTSTKSTPKNTITTFRCSLNDVSDGSQKPRIFQIKPTLNDPKKQVLEIQEEIILPSKSMETDLNNTQTLETTETIEKSQNNKTDHEDCPSNATNTTESTIIDKNPEEILRENLDKNNIENITIAQDDSMNQTDKTNNTNANDPEQISENNLETSQSVKEPDTKTDLNESSVLLSDDCVDLSIVIDDEEDENKQKKHLQSHDLTTDDRDDDSSDIEEISEIIDLNETEDNCDSTVNTSTDSRYSNVNTNQVHTLLPFCTDMLEPPKIGDITIFKVPYVNKKQKTVQTNFIVGRAVYINKRTKAIKICVIDGFMELPNLPNKYIFCNSDESRDSVKYLQLKISEMVEPKIYSRS